MSESSAARQVNPVPTGFIRLRDGRVVVRRSGFLDAGEQLACPFGHRVSGVSNLHEGAITVPCNSRTIASEPRCDCLFYVGTGSMGTFWCDMTAEEDTQIKKLGIRPTGVARFLGIHFPK